IAKASHIGSDAKTNGGISRIFSERVIFQRIAVFRLKLPVLRPHHILGPSYVCMMVVTMPKDQLHRSRDFRSVTKQTAKLFGKRLMLLKRTPIRLINKNQINVRNKFSVAEDFFFRRHFTA